MSLLKISSDWSPLKAQQRKARRTARRLKFIELLGGKCQNCGTTKNLQFDHLEPKDKTLTISKRIDLSDVNLLEEVEKCQLLCRPCHHQKTLKLKQY
jgi:5-methylcytosine-specific restriction endonuclease McrA